MVTFNPSQTLAYVTNFGFSGVSVISVATNSITATIDAGPGPSFVAFNVPAVSYVALDGTATGCTVVGDTLSASSAGTCQVTATMAGDGSYLAVSSPATAVTFPTATDPGAPTDVSATAGDTTAEVLWSAPSNDGGSAIQG